MGVFWTSDLGMNCLAFQKRGLEYTLKFVHRTSCICSSTATHTYGGHEIRLPETCHEITFCHVWPFLSLCAYSWPPNVYMSKVLSPVMKVEEAMVGL